MQHGVQMAGVLSSTISFPHAPDVVPLIILISLPHECSLNLNYAECGMTNKLCGLHVMYVRVLVRSLCYCYQ